MNVDKAQTQYPRTWGRIEKRAREIANSTGYVLAPLAVHAVDGKLSVRFEWDAAETPGIVIAKPILEAVV